MTSETWQPELALAAAGIPDLHIQELESPMGYIYIFQCRSKLSDEVQHEMAKLINLPCVNGAMTPIGPAVVFQKIASQAQSRLVLQSLINFLQTNHGLTIKNNFSNKPTATKSESTDLSGMLDSLKELFER